PTGTFWIATASSFIPTADQSYGYPTPQRIPTPEGLVEKSEKIWGGGIGPRYSPEKITRLAWKGFFQHLLTCTLFRGYAQRKRLSAVSRRPLLALLLTIP
ncbi:MAG: hypothetical protein ACUVQK_06135, partial [Thermogutta sp.]